MEQAKVLWFVLLHWDWVLNQMYSLLMQILGRAKEISDFVKHGESKAFIEIELQDDGQNTIIKRKIDKASHTSVWWINGIVLFTRSKVYTVRSWKGSCKFQHSSRQSMV
jgi:hypothetical protein